MADRISDPVLYEYVQMQLAYYKIRTSTLFDPPIQRKAKAVIAALSPILASLEGDFQAMEKASGELKRYFEEQFPGWETVGDITRITNDFVQ
jgi:hypothetical protein